jgi:hypothetical protein
LSLSARERIPLLFGAIHLHPVQSATAFLSGIAIHLLYLSSRSLLAPLIQHALHNSMVGLLAAFAIGAREDFWRTAQSSPLLLTAASVAVAVLGILLYRSRSRWLLPDRTAWSPGYDTAEMPPAVAGAQLHRAAPSRNLVAATAAIYLVFVAILVWELIQHS